MVSRITPKVRVGGAVLAALLAISMAAAGQGDALRLMSPHAELTGVYDVAATSRATWFVQDGPQNTAGLLVAFTLDASWLKVTNRTYVGQTTVRSAGLPVAEVDPRAIEDSSAFGPVTVEAIDVHPFAALRLVAAGGAPTQAALERIAVFADAAQAPEFDDPHAGVYYHDSELARFHRMPVGTALFRTEAGTIAVDGPFEIWIRGVDLRVRGADGTVSDFTAAPTSVPAAAGPAEADAASWTDFVVTVPAGAHLQIHWASQIDIFAAAASIAGEGEVVFDAARGVAPGLGGPVELEGERHTYAGHLDADTQLRASEADHPTVAWTFAGSRADASQADNPVGGAGWTAAWLWAVLLVGLALAAAPAVWGRSTHRTAPAGHAPVQQPLDATKVPTTPYNRGIALFNAGRLAEALPYLARGVRDRPKDPEGRYAYGVALARSGRFADAIPHLEFAVRRDAAFLGLLVSAEDTVSFRHEPPMAAFVRRMARRFREADSLGYA